MAVHVGATEWVDIHAGRSLRSDAEPGSERYHLAFARAFAYRAVAAWWRAIASEDGPTQPLRGFVQPFELVPLTPSNTRAADKTGASAARLTVCNAVNQLGGAYASLLPHSYRAAHGTYYTPGGLAKRLVEQAASIGVDWAAARVLDPACGGGAFLAPVALRILDELRGCSPRILIENISSRLRGYEIDPFGAWLSQVALDATVLPVAREAGKRLPVVVTVCDSLRMNTPSGQFDLVIGNPPYGRTRLDAVTRTKYQRGLHGHANLYGLFTEFALNQTKRGGVIAYVTPTSFLAGEYFKKLRALLASDAPPVIIDFVAPRSGVFDDVLQETMLATYRRGRRMGRVRVYEASPTDSGSLRIEAIGATRLPAEPSRPWILPRQSEQAALARNLIGMRHRLSDWGFAVSTGPLVWNRHKDQLTHRPGARRFPLIWAEAVTSDGCFVWRAEKKNHTPYFEVRKGDEWLVSACECVLVQRTTAKEQVRRLIAAPLPARFIARHGAVVVENHLNMVLPTCGSPRVSVDVLSAFLNSRAADHAFRCLSGSVAVSAYELESLPLPDPEGLEPLSALVRAGAAREQTETVCAQLYAGSADSCLRFHRT